LQNDQLLNAKFNQTWIQNLLLQDETRPLHVRPSSVLTVSTVL